MGEVQGQACRGFSFSCPYSPPAKAVCALPCAKRSETPGNTHRGWGPGRQDTQVLQRPSLPSLHHLRAGGQSQPQVLRGRCGVLGVRVGPWVTVAERKACGGCCGNGMHTAEKSRTEGGFRARLGRLQRACSDPHLGAALQARCGAGSRGSQGPGLGTKVGLRPEGGAWRGLPESCGSVSAKQEP